MSDTEIYTLPELLRTKAAMIRMGERIAYGSDCDLMEKAADHIERLKSDYRAVCRALCFALTIPPDDIIADSGEEAWMLVGHDAVRGKAVVP